MCKVVESLIDGGVLVIELKDMVVSVIFGDIRVKDLIEFLCVVYVEMYVIFSVSCVVGDCVVGGKIFVIMYFCYLCVCYLVVVGILEI